MASLPFPAPNSPVNGRDAVYVAALPLRATKGPAQMLMAAAYSLNFWDLQHYLVIIRPSSPHSQVLLLPFSPFHHLHWLDASRFLLLSDPSIIFISSVELGPIFSFLYFGLFTSLIVKLGSFHFNFFASLPELKSQYFISALTGWLNEFTICWNGFLCIDSLGFLFPLRIFHGISVFPLCHCLKLGSFSPTISDWLTHKLLHWVHFLLIPWNVIFDVFIETRLVQIYCLELVQLGSFCYTSMTDWIYKLLSCFHFISFPWTVIVMLYGFYISNHLFSYNLVPSILSLHEFHCFFIIFIISVHFFHLFVYIYLFSSVPKYSDLLFDVAIIRII